MRTRRAPQNYLPLLDVISCAFGAIVLLLLISKPSVGSLVEDLAEEIERLRTMLSAVVAEAEDARHQARQLDARLDTERARAAAEAEALAAARSAAGRAQAQAVIEGQLKTALQDLTEEMRRLQQQGVRRDRPDVIGGIPADSEYIIFIIDTSGSMKRFAWEAAGKQMDLLLDAYPKVRGIQVMNDMGEYMFKGYKGRWIPDTERLRAHIRKRFRNWGGGYSNSSPVEGIAAAIRTFRSDSHKTSIYVLGDEFSGRSVQQALDEVDRLNRIGGKRQVRIHAIGFFPAGAVLDRLSNDPSALEHYRQSSQRFSTLMREMTSRNGGTFLGIGSDG